MKTAWLNEEELPDFMVNTFFKKLKESEHFPALLKCFEKIKDSSTIIDLGCGTGEAGRVFSDFKYVGADLPHIIEKVSKIRNPNNNYLKFNAENNNVDFINEFDIVLMNSFLSEIPNWYLILSKILINAKKYVILHRQSITNGQTKFIEYNPYGYNKIKAINNVINYQQLINLFEFNNFEKIVEEKSFPDSLTDKYTFLFKKN